MDVQEGSVDTNMSIQVQNTVDYFPHIATGGKTIFFLEKLYGNDGYAFWFKLLECLATTNNHFLDMRDGTGMEYLCAKANVSIEKGKMILDQLSRLDAIDKELWDEGVVWSKNFLDGVASVYKNRKRNSPLKPIITEGIELYVPEPTSSLPVDYPQPTPDLRDKGEERIGEDRIGNEKKPKDSKPKKPKPEFIMPEKYLNDTNFVIAWDAYVENRIQMKKPLTELAKNNKIKGFEVYPIETCIAALKASVENCWQGVFPESVKVNYGGKPQGKIFRNEGADKSSFNILTTTNGGMMARLQQPDEDVPVYRG